MNSASSPWSYSMFIAYTKTDSAKKTKPTVIPVGWYDDSVQLIVPKSIFLKTF